MAKRNRPPSPPDGGSGTTAVDDQTVTAVVEAPGQVDDVMSKPLGSGGEPSFEAAGWPAAPKSAWNDSQALLYDPAAPDVPGGSGEGGPPAVSTVTAGPTRLIEEPVHGGAPSADEDSDEPADPLVGTVLHGYQIQALLGAGAVARVYRARHLVLEHQYAVKVLYGASATHERARERLRREAQALSWLRHPNIVSVVDFGTTPRGFPFLTMELVEGRTLRQVIKTEAPLSATQAAGIARQIAEALAYAHQRGVVHRDVKPSNVMLDPRGHVKVLDFGIARIHASDGIRLTVTDALLGTPRYMAPEQITGASDVGPTADLYALGVIMYEMLSGRVPFHGSTIEVVQRQLTEAPHPLESRTGLEPLVARLLEKQPELRPSSGADVVAAIDRTAPAPEVPRPEPEIKPRGAATGWVPWIAIAAGVAAVSAGFTTAMLSSAEPPLPMTLPTETSPVSDPIDSRASPIVEPRVQAESVADPGPTDGSTEPPGGSSPDRRRPEATTPPRRTDSTRRLDPGSASTRVAEQRRWLEQRGLNIDDVRSDPALSDGWRGFARAVKSGDRARIRDAQARLEAAVQGALTVARARARLDGFAARLRSVAASLPPNEVARFEDTYLDLRASVGPDDPPTAVAETLRRVRQLESELASASREHGASGEDQP